MCLKAKCQSTSSEKEKYLRNLKLETNRIMDFEVERKNGSFPCDFYCKI